MEYIFLSFSMTVTFPLILLVDWFLSNLKGQTTLTFLDSTVKTAIIILFLVPLFHYWHCYFCSLSVFYFYIFVPENQKWSGAGSLIQRFGGVHSQTHIRTHAGIHQVEKRKKHLYEQDRSRIKKCSCSSPTLCKKFRSSPVEILLPPFSHYSTDWQVLIMCQVHRKKTASE